MPVRSARTVRPMTLDSQPVDISTEGAVTIVRMTNGENRCNPTMIRALNEAFDAVAASDGPAAIVLTGSGKFFSNGLDLDWMGTVSLNEASALVDELHELLARILLSPVPIIAALNGHTFAAGAMIALACDYRVMRNDRGYFCLPEADINLPFSKGMNALIRATLPLGTSREAMLTGRRYTAREAIESGIVDAIADEADVVSDAVRRARDVAGKQRSTIEVIKREMFGPVAELLRQSM